jgi:hypothetical protein
MSPAQHPSKSFAPSNAAINQPMPDLSLGQTAQDRMVDHVE